MAMTQDFIPDDAYLVAKSDTVPQPGCGFMVGVAGNVAIVTARGTTVTLPACAAGAQYAIKFNFILSTGTTASTIVAFRG